MPPTAEQQQTRTWVRVGPSEYISNDGHRVYRYACARSGWQVTWGAHPKGSFGDVAGRTKQQAIAFIDRYYPYQGA